MTLDIVGLHMQCKVTFSVTFMHFGFSSPYPTFCRCINTWTTVHYAHETFVLIPPQHSVALRSGRRAGDIRCLRHWQCQIIIAMLQNCQKGRET